MVSIDGSERACDSRLLLGAHVVHLSLLPSASRVRSASRARVPPCSAALAHAGHFAGAQGPYEDYAEMLQFATTHGIKPQVEVYPVSEINAAITKVRNNTARYRIVIAL